MRHPCNELIALYMKKAEVGTLARKADAFIPILVMILVHKSFSSSTHQVKYRGKNEEREKRAVTDKYKDKLWRKKIPIHPVKKTLLATNHE